MPHDLSGCLAALLAALLLGAGAPLHAQPAVGDGAPEIDLSRAIGYEGAEWLSELRGRAVVLEFWATWCGPCIPALDHLARVAGAVANEPVTFLTITDEPEPAVRRFLSRRAVSLPIVLDADTSAFRAYRPAGRPHTVLVYPDGTVAAHTRPEAVTPDVVRALVASAPLDTLAIAETRRPPPPPAADGRLGSYDDLSRSDLHRLDSLTLYKAEIRPYSGDGASLFFYNRPGSPYAYRRAILRGWPINLLTWAENAFHIDVDDQAGLPEASHFADVIVPSGSPGMAEVKAEARRLIERTFGVVATREVRPTDVLRLERIEGAELGVRRATGRGTAAVRGSSFSGPGQPFEVFLLYLGSHLPRRLVDRTGLDGGVFTLYDIEMEFAHGVPGDLEAALAGLGLRLVPEDGRPIETLVIRPVGTD